MDRAGQRGGLPGLCHDRAEPDRAAQHLLASSAGVEHRVLHLPTEGHGLRELDPASVPELDVENPYIEMLALQETAERFADSFPDSFDQPPAIKQVAVTPDFHKGRGVPVGTVLATQGFLAPQAIGNDVNCGMRLHVTSLQEHQIAGQVEELDTVFRHIFFEGGRNIPMSRPQREALWT